VTQFKSGDILYLLQAAAAVFSGITGVLSKSITYLFETAKKRLQAMGFAEGQA